jgi:lipopolysaccharide/colanic/teichoic acid biosynthesis glycosyltransferase
MTESLAPDARAAEASLSERYRRIANEALEDRPVDGALRTLDVLIAGASLLALAPVLAIVAAAVRLTSRGPVLYRGPRIGRGGQIFVMMKFRTLKQDAESRLGPHLGLELSRRTGAEMTPVGGILRATYIDEVPQLWNVLRGEMSVVGPRPIRPLFFEQLCQDIPQYWQRLVVRPGLTGFAQLRLGRDLSWSEKLAHDLEYIADRSVRLYLSVVVATVRRVMLPRYRAARAA